MKHIKTTVIVNPKAFSFVRNVSRSKSGSEFEGLMLLLQGESVEASIYSERTNVVGRTNKAKLEECYGKLDTESKRIYLNPDMFGKVVEKFGCGKLGFDISGSLHLYK